MNNKQNPMMGGQNLFGNMPMGKRTPKAIKWVIIFLCGILPFILMAFLVGTDDTVWDNWGQKLNTVYTVQYGVMWAVGIVTILIASIALSLIVVLSSEVQTDVVPMTIGFLFMGLGFYVIPFPGLWSLLFIIVAPVLFLLGVMLAVIVVGLITLKKIMKASQDPEVQKQVKEMQEQMKRGNMPGQPPKPPKDKEENYQDNPFVDVKEDEEDK